VLVFATLYLSWRTFKATQEKQVAERFSKAVEQLGSENIHVRLGGIYALEQIAKDAEEKYYWQVMETLTSYVRERSPYPPRTVKKQLSFIQVALTPPKNDNSSSKKVPSLSTDIQAVMTVLARRNHTYKHSLEPHRLDLRKTNLQKLQLPPNATLQSADFSEANLKWAFLVEANLQKADFTKANLQEATLNNAELQGTNFQGADLERAILSGAKLQKAILLDANLKQANFDVADLQGANLGGAEMQGARLVEANLRETDLRLTNLQRTNLFGAKLQGAKLFKADLGQINLKGANLQGARFEFAKLQEAQLYGANLQNANLQKAIGLTAEQLQEANFVKAAILPDYLLQNLQTLQTEADNSPDQKPEIARSPAHEKPIQPEETPPSQQATSEET
jgi:uncharacterized protein YjbI with pentapeptide repeats